MIVRWGFCFTDFGVAFSARFLKDDTTLSGDAT